MILLQIAAQSLVTLWQWLTKGWLSGDVKAEVCTSNDGELSIELELIPMREGHKWKSCPHDTLYPSPNSRARQAQPLGVLPTAGKRCATNQKFKVERWPLTPKP